MGNRLISFNQDNTCICCGSKMGLGDRFCVIIFTFLKFSSFPLTNVNYYDNFFKESSKEIVNLEKEMEMKQENEEKVLVNFRMPKSLYRQLKTIAAAEDQKIGDILNELVEEYIPVSVLPQIERLSKIHKDHLKRKKKRKKLKKETELVASYE